MRKRSAKMFGILIFLLVMVIPGFVIAVKQGGTVQNPNATVIAPIPVVSKFRTDVFVPVLTYHRVLAQVESQFDYSPAQLEEHFRYLKVHGYHPITAAQMMSCLANPGLFPAHPIVLSFDDGHPSHYDIVFPLLKKYGFPATFFVYPNLITEKSKHSLTWVKLAQMARAGEDIESHTMSHPYLTHRQGFKDRQSYLQWLDHELAGSRRKLEQALHQKVTLLAYPYGWFNATVENEARKAGYQGVFTVNWGNNGPDSNPLRIRRRVMSNVMSLNDLERYLTARPLKLQIIEPADTAVIGQSPAVQFKILTPGLKKVDVFIRTSRYTVTPNSQGVYQIPKLTGLKPGFYMIIMRGSDVQNNHYLDSWSFDYEPS